MKRKRKIFPPDGKQVDFRNCDKFCPNLFIEKTDEK
jgi:hypothetical protein